MKLRSAAVAVSLLVALVASAEPKHSLEYTAGSCARGGELVLMQLNVEGDGDLRSYFRRTNTTDWCSVDGTNDGPLSRVVLPKFEPGDEIEYFFVLLDGRRVVARSPRIYRVRITNDCGTPFARNVSRLALNCGNDATGIPTSMGAGYAITEDLVDGQPPVGSPDRPVVIAAGRP